MYYISSSGSFLPGFNRPGNNYAGRSGHEKVSPEFPNLPGCIDLNYSVFEHAEGNSPQNENSAGNGHTFSLLKMAAKYPDRGIKCNYRPHPFFNHL